MRNFKLSDDISFRFADTNWSEYPLTADKFINWIEKLDKQEVVTNLFFSYEAFGERQAADTGIFEFLKTFSKEVVKKANLSFATPTEVVEKLQPVSVVSVPYPISWADEERDLTAWLGNKMQKEAYEKLYQLKERMAICTDPELIKDWNYLQVSDHFYYMSTKLFSDGEVHSYFNPFNSPYEAFINYMNVLSDFKIRLNEAVPVDESENQLAALQDLVKEKEAKIARLKADLRKEKEKNNH